VKIVKVVRYKSINGTEYLTKLSALKADFKFRVRKLINKLDIEDEQDLIYNETIKLAPILGDFLRQYEDLTEVEKQTEDKNVVEDCRKKIVDNEDNDEEED